MRLTDAPEYLATGTVRALDFYFRFVAPYALFSRSGFTEQLTAQANSENVWLVGLEDVVEDG